MSTVTHDEAVSARAERLGVGLLLAAVSAVSFSMSGSIATSLFAIGWTPGAVVLVRVGVAAAVLAPFGLRAMRGRVSVVVLRRELPAIAGYGLLAVAATQFCYFSAVQHMEVAPAILVEYTSPAAVVLWLWLRHGQRPSMTTVTGAVVAALGLVLVLDLVGGGAGLSLVGVLWALGAMVGAVAYFLLNAEGGIDLPPLALAWLGLVAGAVVLAVLGAAHLMPLQAATGTVTLAHAEVPWWCAVLVLGAVTAALAYATGIAAGRVLGPRLASFVALFEVVASVLFAWALLGELPRVVQLVGGLLILAGVIAVKAGEPTLGASDPVDGVPLPAGESR
ncbi:DMT family transporter [Nocardioides sp.]|jgi:drug/metabolite transporter (DMT)-like permease|uniref:EamA family transporter n=1 Tax=Nocardioides sp. TaxID=35761 RepID=UPI002D18AA96|nr:DMT family transporter [Nocardioides sp.]HVX55368.1 DMT family transporter [Nocardioides sp.]